MDKARNTNRQALIFKLYNDLLDLYNINKTETISNKVEFIWEHYRRSWQECKRPVFIDFGNNFLLQVTEGMGKKYGKGNMGLKDRFLQKYCVK